MKKRGNKDILFLITVIIIIFILGTFSVGLTIKNTDEDSDSLFTRKLWFFSKPECRDGEDNDGDGRCDFEGCYIGKGKNKVWSNPDPDCESASDSKEKPSCDSPTKECGVTNIGICRYGIQICSNGVWSSCEGEITPTEEICDYLDNDCDGQIDEELTKQCGTSNVGECDYGTSTCEFGVWNFCKGNTEPLNETCDNRDNDCDGTIDDGCTCSTGQTKQCGNNIGECEYGLQTCSGGVWGACIGGTLPTTEICDSKDNNCNGLTDEVCGNGSI